MAIIRDSSYDATERALMNDATVKAMAAQLPAGLDLHSWEFTVKAMNEYTCRTGKTPGHIGAVAAAIRQILGA